MKKLEQVFSVGEPVDDWIDVVMWEGLRGGIFGHAHYRFSKSRGESECVACSDDEEIELMRQLYSSDDRKLFGQELKMSFPEYLEHFCYLGCEELEPKRREIIERLRREEAGV